jgi:hypothetical protein
LARDDTTLEAAGAEHLVVGGLLIDGLPAFRAYPIRLATIYSLSTQDSPVLKVQVKSRGAVDSGAFRIESFDLDFVIFVRLNRGTKASRKAGQREGALASPEARLPKGWLRSHPDFLENWDLNALADPQAD